VPSIRKRLNPQFRNVILAKFRAGDVLAQSLSDAGGYPHGGVFSRMLYARRIPYTPLTLARLARVASVIGFDGPLFLDDEPKAEMSRP
jgi:hypothetical protein